MTNKTIRIIGYLTLVLLVTACKSITPTQPPTMHTPTQFSTTPPPTPTAAPLSTSPTEESVIPERCQVAGLETFVSPNGDYCFTYPSGFSLGEFAPGEPGVFGPPLDQSPEPLRAGLWIHVEAAPEQAGLDAFVDEFLTQFADMPVPSIIRTDIGLDGEPAIQLEVVPGREGSRDVFAIHAGHLYRLIFLPSVVDFPQAAPDVEILYQVITGSFTFLEAHTLANTRSEPPLTSNPLADLVGQRASTALVALQNRDMQTLVSLVHPTRGLRFSPYAYVQDRDRVLMPDQLLTALSDQTPYNWGSYDGSGLPIEMPFAQYYADFVYDHDFASAPHTSYNERIGFGNTLDNSQEFYPDAIIVEYHFPGFDPQYGGMDWASLRLVFQEQAGTWYLVGLIHDQWTI